MNPGPAMSTLSTPASARCMRSRRRPAISAGLFLSGRASVIARFVVQSPSEGSRGRSSNGLDASPHQAHARPLRAPRVFGSSELMLSSRERLLASRLLPASIPSSLLAWHLTRPQAWQLTQPAAGFDFAVDELSDFEGESARSLPCRPSSPSSTRAGRAVTLGLSSRPFRNR